MALATGSADIQSYASEIRVLSTSSSGKPSRAKRMAGAMTSASVIVPYSSSASAKPATTPGTQVDSGP